MALDVTQTRNLNSPTRPDPTRPAGIRGRGTILGRSQDQPRDLVRTAVRYEATVLVAAIGEWL
jgi:hypothetical protein